MPSREWAITLLNRELDESVTTTEPLLFPEICCADGRHSRVRGVVRDLLRQVLEHEEAWELHQRILASAPKAGRVEVTLDPPKRKVEWTEPVTLRFDVVRWSHGDDAVRAFVPALGIEVVARREPELEKRIAEHVLAAVRRGKAAESLFKLALLQRDDELSLEPVTLTVHHKTPKQLARDTEDEDETKKKPVIQEVGLVLGTVPLHPAYEVDALVEQMADLLTGRSPRSVLLVGPSGVGKTAAVHELVRRRKTTPLGDTPVWSTGGARLVAGMAGFGMWQQRCQRLCKEAARDQAILHVGNLVELMEVGRAGGSQGIAGFFKTPLGRGELLVVAECTVEQLGVIERQDPHLLELFHPLRVEEPTAEAGRAILRSVAAASPNEIRLFDGWLDALDRLHRRYATYSAAPGRPVRFLRNLLQDGSDDVPIGAAEVTAAFSRETGLPLALLDPAVPLDLAAARGWFAARLIGQPRAIDLITDLLATVKATLTRPRRPIASLLFVGPTGVGKTEMAKAIAEYFFGDRSRLTRFDMSEFASPAAVGRLIGGVFGEEGLLTAKVREQPFSVLLFDEFEKADGGFFDLLLQVLGDGRLTDAAGRVADFSNTIVIMTSNLGAESFGRGTFGLKRGGGYPDAELHFTDEVRSFVRPELFNRLDRVVPFLPLAPDSILRIADKELALVRGRDGFRLRGMVMTLSPEARDRLAEKGYDPRYGARPLKRAIERQLLSPLADAMNRYPPEVALEAAVGTEGGELTVAVRARVGASGRPAPVAATASGVASVAEAYADLRRDVQRLPGCPAVLTVTNLLFQLDREQARKEARRKAKAKPVYDADRAERIRDLRQILDAVGSLSADADAAEDLALAAVYGTPLPTHGVADPPTVSAMEARLYDLLLRLLARGAAQPHRVILGLFGNRAAALQLAAAYRSAALANGCRAELTWYSIHGRSSFRRHRVDDVAALFDSPPAELAGLSMAVAGPYAGLRFSPEKGVHVFREDAKSWACLVDAGAVQAADYAPPGIENWPTDLGGIDPRRLYDLSAHTARDSVLGREFRWSGRDIEPTVAQAIDLLLRRSARAVIAG